MPDDSTQFLRCLDKVHVKFLKCLDKTNVKLSECSLAYSKCLRDLATMKIIT